MINTKNLFFIHFQKDITAKKILHFTDTHIDFDYVVGAKAVCGEPLCCRKDAGMAGERISSLHFICVTTA